MSTPSVVLNNPVAAALLLVLPLCCAAPPAGAAGAGGKPVAKPAAAASAAAPVDPLEQLRQRLAQRLAGRAAQKTAGPSDLRVVARTPAAGSAAVAAKAAAARPVGRKVADGHAAQAVAATNHWSYAGPGGPASWGGACNSGRRQSPIDIRGGLAVDLDPVRFAYQATRFGVVDNGHTVQANVAAGNHIVVGGKRFELQQFHFHRPSEERIDGRQFEMSVHLVHKDDQGRLAVVTLLLDKGPAQPVVQKVWNNLPLERGEETVAQAPLDLNDLLPADRKYYTYMGSLTTPPCSEGVQWIVMRQPVSATAEQIELFARIYPMNSRPLQAAAGRRILQSD